MLRRALKIVAFPLAVLVVFGVLYAIWRALDLPPEATIISVGKSYLDHYGLIVAFICGYVEALVVVGWYFPGTLVVIAAMIAAVSDPVRYVETAALAACGLYCGQVTNFFAGRHGWCRLLLAFGLREPLEKAQRRLTKYGLSAIFTTYWQANLASCISTGAGVLEFPARRFLVLAFLAQTFWSGFWAILIFLLGPAALSLAGFRMILLLVLIWIAARVIWRWKFEKQTARA